MQVSGVKSKGKRNTGVWAAGRMGAIWDPGIQAGLGRGGICRTPLAGWGWGHLCEGEDAILATGISAYGEGPGSTTIQQPIAELRIGALVGVQCPHPPHGRPRHCCLRHRELV